MDKPTSHELGEDGIHPSWLVRKIVHIDMDCFYAAVEMLDQPQYRGKPLIVGGREQRGVVSAANYEARAYGIKSAMPISQALALCRHAINVPVRMSRYKEVSMRIHEIFSRYTDLIQPISLDEAFLDVTQNKLNEPYATEIAKGIKAAIRNELGLSASAGVAPNRFLAKIASDIRKPDGLYVIKPNQVGAFVKQLPIKKIWGVGKVMGKAMQDLGIHLAVDLQKFPADFLEKKFGKMGRQLSLLAQGIDESPVVVEGERKSIGKERTFIEDVSDEKVLRETLINLVDRCAQRLEESGLGAGGVCLKIKYQDFRQVTRSKALGEGYHALNDFRAAAQELLNGLLPVERGVRLLGVSFYKLDSMSTETHVEAWL